MTSAYRSYSPIGCEFSVQKDYFPTNRMEISEFLSGDKISDLIYKYLTLVIRRDLDIRVHTLVIPNLTKPK